MFCKVIMDANTVEIGLSLFVKCTGQHLIFTLYDQCSLTKTVTLTLVIWMQKCDTTLREIQLFRTDSFKIVHKPGMLSIHY